MLIHGRLCDKVERIGLIAGNGNWKKKPKKKLFIRRGAHEADNVTRTMSMSNCDDTLEGGE